MARLLAAALVALLATCAIARRVPPRVPTEADALAMTHAELARAYIRMFGGDHESAAPAEVSAGPATYWWYYPQSDCDNYDIEGSCKGMSVQECKELCLKTEGCAGFNFPHGYLKSADCLKHKGSSDGSVDLFVLASRPQPANEAWPPVWPMPAKYTNGSVTVAVDRAAWKWPEAASKDLQAAYARFEPLFFPHPTSAKVPAGALASLVVKVTDLEAELQPGMDESYTLDIPSDGSAVRVLAGTVFGAYHALQTLSQLVSFDFATETYSIPGAPWHIEDAPRFTHRELLIDTSRHFQPVPVIKNVIDGATYTKINVIHWHIVDTQSFPFIAPSMPELGLLGSYSPQERYTATEVADVIEYARQRGVRVMMEIDVPGHAASWCHADLSICPSDSCREPLNVANEHTFDVIKGIIGDITTLSKDQMVHLGGDEVDTKCWRQSAEISKWLVEHHMSAESGYEYFVNRGHEIVQSFGRDVVGWEEIWNHFGTHLAKGTIIHQWIAGSTIAHNATSHGYRVIWSTSSVWYLDWLDITWRKMYTAEPCADIPAAECAEFVLGGGGEMWGETVDASDIMSTVFPRLGAIGERLWSPRKVNDADAAAARYASFRCLLNARGIGAAPHANNIGRAPPSGPGGCYAQ